MPEVDRTVTTTRHDWVDVAKGICILLVVMMHATLGVEKALGLVTGLNAFIEWCKPFRLPDFFLISGLFVASRIHASWSIYLDRKVTNLAYCYVLWMHILIATKAPMIVAAEGSVGLLELYLRSWIVPFGPLWFLYLLVVLFIVTKATAALPKGFVLLLAAIVHIAAPRTGVFLIDELIDKLVFFYAGYALAPRVFAFAEELRATSILTLMAIIGLWAIVHTMAFETGWTEVPGIGLFISFAGIGGVIAASVLLVRFGVAGALAFCGRNSIKIYVAFTLFMGPARSLLMKFAPWLSGETVALASMTAGIVGALALARIVEGTELSLLFRRPRFGKRAADSAIA